MFTNSAVLLPVFSASFQYQQEVLLDELLYLLALFPVNCFKPEVKNRK